MKKLLCWAVVCLPQLSWATSGRVDIARFFRGDLSGWQPKVFSSETRYSLENSMDGLPCMLKAPPPRDSACVLDAWCRLERAKRVDDHNAYCSGQ